MIVRHRIATMVGAALAACLSLASTAPAVAAERSAPDYGSLRASFADYDSEAWLATAKGFATISAEVAEIQGVSPEIVAANLAHYSLGSPEIVPCSQLQKSDSAVLPPTEVEGTSAVCGYVDVPERYDVPNPETIRLAYVTLESPSSEPDPAAAIQLAGGPGQGATQFAAFTFGNPEVESVEERLRTTRDVIFLDQRGTGASQPVLDCPDSDAVTDTAACRDALIATGVDLSGYTTLSNSIDQFVVRTALRYPSVTLNGTSYGAKLAYQTTRWDTGWIEEVVVGSPISGEENYLEVQPTSFQGALDAVYEDCAAQEGCATAFPDTSGGLDRVSTLLTETPQEVTYTSLIDGAEKSLTLDGSAFSGLIYQMVFSGFASQVPILADAADGGNLAPAAAFLEVFSGGGGIAVGMFLSVVCAEEGASLDGDEQASRIAETQPIVQGLFAVDDLGPICDVWGVPAADPATYAPEPAANDTPILVVAGRYDPITPPTFGEEIEASNDGTVFVEGAASGHDPLSFLGTCAAGIVEQFVTEAEVDATCAATPTEFLLPQPAQNMQPVLPDEMPEPMPLPMMG